MTEKEIITEIERYLADTSYNYAVMIDGDWGCGKTYFVKNSLTDAINKQEKKSEKPRKPVYVSLYGYKTVLDIQDAIAIQLHLLTDGDNKTILGKLGKKRIIGKSVQSALTFAKAARDIYAPTASIFDLEGIWRDLTAYIFIFDDIERCDCPVNEVFGFINGLVEHDGVKVILVANEKEIQTHEITELKEIQYLVSSNEKIVFPKVESVWRDGHEIVPLSPEELERRRKILFPTVTVDEGFKKIKEKLIGVTLHFQPDIKLICRTIICGTDFGDEIKEKLNESTESFYATMHAAGHLNLRTFQFFISKIKCILDVFPSLTIPSENMAAVKEKVISDCFACAVDFKANTRPPESETEQIVYSISLEKRSKAIKKYIETGGLDIELLQQEIRTFIEENPIELIPADDPYKVLQHEYSLHPQTWCEEKMRDVLDKLSKNEYPIFAYGDIVRVFLIYESMGFDSSYLDRAKEQMLKNIMVADRPKALETHLYLTEENKEVINRAKSVLAEINNAIADKNNTTKICSVEEILGQENWIDGLTKIVEENNLRERPDGNVFSSVDSCVWLDLLKKSSPETLSKFRQLFNWLYPTSIIRQVEQHELDVIETIANGIDPSNAEDLVVKNILSWTKQNMEKVCILYGKNSIKNSTEEVDNNG